MAINRVLLLGKVADPGPKLAYSEQGRPECRLLLKLTEPSKARQAFSVFIPVYMYGTAAEQVAEQIDAGDKGAKIATALDDFKGVVLAQVCQAGLSVPVPAEKRASDFIPASTQAAIIKTAGELSPGDYVKGVRRIEAALQEILSWAAERGAASGMAACVYRDQRGPEPCSVRSFSLSARALPKKSVLCLLCYRFNALTLSMST